MHNVFPSGINTDKEHISGWVCSPSMVLSVLPLDLVKPFEVIVMDVSSGKKIRISELKDSHREKSEEKHPGIGTLDAP